MHSPCRHGILFAVMKMLLRDLQECLNSVDEIAVIGREATVDGVLCHVVGLLRRGTVASLLLMTYDEAYRELLENAEIEELTSPRERETYRTQYRQDIAYAKNDLFDSIETVCVGDRVFTAAMGETTVLDNPADIMLLCEFMKKGWLPQTVGEIDSENLYLTTIELMEETDSLAGLGGSVTFTTRQRAERFLVEKKVRLTVGQGRNRALKICDPKTGEAYDAYIQSVGLLDLHAEMEKIYSDPAFLQNVSADELAVIRADSERQFPAGTFYPVIEYECALSLNFELTKHLNAVPDYRGDGATGIILSKPEQETGRHGMKLRSDVVQIAVPPDTGTLDAEVFSAYRLLPERTFTI